MFKRCHSLKKSSINISNFSKPKSSEKSILTQDGDKQNLQTNQTYTLKTSTKIKISESIEMKNSQTMLKVSKPGIKIKQRNMNIVNEQRQIEQVKSLCKKIEQMEGKISSYRDLLNRKQARHKKQRNQLMNEKEQKLSLMIELYQKQRLKNERLHNQLQQLGVHTSDTMYMSTNEPELQRRTTATFNFTFHRS